jgi:hypothetical protein
MAVLFSVDLWIVFRRRRKSDHFDTHVWGKLALPDNIIYDILAIYTEEVASILHTFHKKHFMELVGL